MNQKFRRIKNLCSRLLLHSHSHLTSLLIILVLLFIIIYKLNFPAIILDDKKYNWLESNRNISYFLGRYYENQSVKCKYNTKTLIAVITALTHSSQRNAIRETLQRNLPPTWTLLFFTGKSQNEEFQGTIEKEKENFEDIVMLDVEDSYLNLTIKVTLVLEWVNGNCKQAKFILKMDDDIYVNLPNMIKFTDCLTFVMDSSKIPTTCNHWETKDIVGNYIDSKTKEYHSYVAGGYVYKGIVPDRNLFSKWYTSPTLFSEPIFPTFLSGTSYLLTTNLIPLILDQISQVPLISLEDVYITGLIITQTLNLKLSHVEGWNHFRPQWDGACLYKTMLTAHGLNPEEIKSMTVAVNNVKDCNGLLQQSFSYFNKFISYYIPKYKL